MGTAGYVVHNLYWTSSNNNIGLSAYVMSPRFDEHTLFYEELINFLYFSN